MTHAELSDHAAIEVRKWYAIAVRSRCEKKVSRGLGSRNVEWYLPLIEEVHTWSDRKKRIKVPLFPGYIFVYLDLKDRLETLTVEGVVKFVGTSSKPDPIPEEQINWVKMIEGRPGTMLHESRPPVGQMVRVIAGPFQGLRGIVNRLKGATRVVITLETIARSISVEVAPEHLESM